MNIKQEIEKLLIDLKKRGVDRRSIEIDMDYSEGYIDQLLSKGGNKKFLKRLAKYNVEKNNIHPHETITLNDGHIFNRLLRVLEQHAETISSQQQTIKHLTEKPPDMAKNG